MESIYISSLILNLICGVSISNTMNKYTRKFELITLHNYFDKILIFFPFYFFLIYFFSGNFVMVNQFIMILITIIANIFYYFMNIESSVILLEIYYINTIIFMVLFILEYFHIVNLYRIVVVLIFVVICFLIIYPTINFIPDENIAFFSNLFLFFMCIYSFILSVFYFSNKNSLEQKFKSER